MSIKASAYDVRPPSPPLLLYTRPGKRRTEFIIDASMELDMRQGAARDEPAERVQNYLDTAMQGDLVHLVERPIHQQRKVAFDLKILPFPEAHETADGGILAERYQRAKIPVEIRLQRLALQPAGGLVLSLE